MLHPMGNAKGSFLWQIVNFSIKKWSCCNVPTSSSFYTTLLFPIVFVTKLQKNRQDLLQKYPFNLLLIIFHYKVSVCCDRVIGASLTPSSFLVKCQSLLLSFSQKMASQQCYSFYYILQFQICVPLFFLLIRAIVCCIFILA